MVDAIGTAAHTVRTPATGQFLAALTAGDWEAALDVLDDHWTEIWYALDPTDLRRLIAQAPPRLLAGRGDAGYIARVAGHGATEDLVEPVPRPGPNAEPERIAQYVADQRLRGRPVEAMGYVRRLQERARAVRGQLMDGSGGAEALWLVQGATTALLAGDATTARGLLLAATTTHRPDRYPFVIRDAVSKLALTEAIAGDIDAAQQWNERARGIARSASWVEALVDDTIWLTDYLCSIDRLDPRAEELRLDRPSPLTLLEFWTVALAAHVRHLVVTDRAGRAAELCDAVAAAGLPQPDSDGPVATAVADARAVCSSRRVRESAWAVPRTAEQVLARAVHLFTTGQFQAALDLAAGELLPTADARPALALRLVEGQAGAALGHTAEGRHVVLAALEEVLERQVFSLLRYLTADTLADIGDTAAGARAAQLVQEAGLPTLVVETVLASPLTAAELKALRLLGEGRTRAEMAALLFVSVNTVKSQLASAYRKLGVTTRADALAMLARLGL